MAATITPGKAIREHCITCLGANSAFGAYDCQSAICPLSACQPFWGKRFAQTTIVRKRPAAMKHRRPSKAFIAAACRQCSPDTKDCISGDCALLSFTPFQPGGQPKRALSEQQVIARRERMRAVNATIIRPRQKRACIASRPAKRGKAQDAILDAK